MRGRAKREAHVKDEWLLITEQRRWLLDGWAGSGLAGGLVGFTLALHWLASYWLASHWLASLAWLG